MTESYKHSTLEASKLTKKVLPRIMSILEKMSADKSEPLQVLEVGAGNGFVSNILKREGYEVTALEPSDDGAYLIATAYPDIKLIKSQIETIEPALNSQYDVVVCLEVVEHVYNPKEFIRSIYKALKQDGRLIITTPYHGYIKNILIALLGLSDKHYTVLWENGHIKFFSIKTLTELLALNGFVCLNTCRFGRVLPQFAESMLAVAEKK